MKERPVIFNGEMVRAILDGRKTQTRRVLTERQLHLIDVASSAGECYPLEHGGVERLNSISEEDAISEGIDADRLAESQDNYDCIADHNMTGRPTAKGYFSDLWQSIYGVENWLTNPWVWVIEFKRVGGSDASK